MPISNPNEIIECSKSELVHLNPDDFTYAVELVQDEQEPFHPQQGPADVVKCNVQQIKRNYKGKLPAPLGFMFQINFTARSEGWFKLKCDILFQNRIVVQTYSNTFMLNNPRLKKMKEHKLYTSEQLKFMQIYSLCEENDSIPAAYWARILTERNMDTSLIEKASLMFPPAKKSRTNSKKRKLPPSADDPSSKRTKL